MRPVGGVGATAAIRIGTSRSSQLTPSPETEAGHVRADGQRALVSLAPTGAASDKPASAQRSSADFLAHLIATAAQLPQTRDRRRAEPQDAIAAYTSAAGASLAPPQKVLRSS
jgi:hypothetical protein